MTNITCSIDGCTKPSRRMTWCHMHYVRYNRHGHPLAMAPRITLWERIERKIAKSDHGCWTWGGHHNIDTGYAQLRVNSRGADSGAVYVHREVFKHYYGPVPVGLVVDHICHNRGCVNPDHLRAITQKQNTENRSGLGADNTSGYVGVSRARGRWDATVTHWGVTHRAGRFDTAEEAGAAARALRLQLFTHNDHDRS